MSLSFSASVLVCTSILARHTLENCHLRLSAARRCLLSLEVTTYEHDYLEARASVVLPPASAPAIPAFCKEQELVQKTSSTQIRISITSKTRHLRSGLPITTMRLSKTTALLALPAATLAVTLSDFKSNADTLKEADLPADCAKVYKADISGCQASDFTGGNGCSSGCVDAMDDMVDKVRDACGSDKLDGTSIITVFLSGNVGAICPGAATVTSSSSPSTAPQTTKAASTSSMSQTSATDSESASTSSTQSNTTSTTTNPSTSSTTSSLIVDTSRTATPTRTQTSSQTSASSHSGQGSPFDTQPNYSGAVTAASLCLTTMALAIAAVFGAVLQ